MATGGSGSCIWSIRLCHGVAIRSSCPWSSWKRKRPPTEAASLRVVFELAHGQQVERGFGANAALCKLDDLPRHERGQHVVAVFQADLAARLGEGVGHVLQHLGI